MERVSLPGGVELSRIVYGMWRVGDDADTSPAHIRAKIEACLDQGITTIDQADIYGGYTAEGLLGACFKENPGFRDRCEIVTKCDIVAPVGRYESARVKHYDTSAAHIAMSIDKSLAEMAIEHIDLLLIHRPDPSWTTLKRDAPWTMPWPAARSARSVCRTSDRGTGRFCNRQ